MKYAAWILNLLVAIPFVASAVMKITQNPLAVEGFSKMGVPPGAIIPIGLVELLCLGLFLLPRTAFLGTLLLTGYLGGAVLANLIAGTDLIHVAVIGLMAWASSWIRIPEFRALMPFRPVQAPAAVGRKAAA
jgi:hypothetical protein